MTTQDQLHHKFKYFGTKHLEFRQKCIGLLPQIFKEKIFEKKGFASIFEYAAKLAGLSQEQVKRALSLEEKFKEMPALKNLLTTGEASINKLAKIASIATTENQEQLAESVQSLSCRALETFARDIRIASPKNPNGSIKADSSPDFVHVNKIQSKMTELQLTDKNLERLLDLQKKKIDINEIIETALNARENEIKGDKDAITNELLEKPELASSRHIPAKVRQIIDREQGETCCIPGCKKPAKEIHHEIPFSILKTHNPENLKKLCKGHHEISHAINIKILKIKREAVNSS